MKNKRSSAETKSVDEPIAKRLRNSTRTSNGEVLESFIKNPGLQHISEKIFQCLNKKSLMEYRLMNSSWNQILEQPIFWLKKLKVDGFSVERYPRLNFYTQKVIEDPETKKKLVLDMIKESIKETRIRNEICIRNEKIRKKVNQITKLCVNIMRKHSTLNG